MESTTERSVARDSIGNGYRLQTGDLVLVRVYFHPHQVDAGRHNLGLVVPPVPRVCMGTSALRPYV